MKINYKKLEKEAPLKGIRMIVLFGSQALGRERSDSDCDVAVLTTPEKNMRSSMKNYNDILEFLCRIFGVREDKIDLTNLNRANPLLRYEIFSGGKLIYGSADEFEEQKAFSFRNYIDAKPLFALEDYLVKRRCELIRHAIEKQ